VGSNQAARRTALDYAHVHHELHKSTATLELLWSEYQEGVAARGDELKPYQYSQFCELYGAWRVRLKPSMRRVHRAGEKAFLAYSGKKPRVFERETGKERLGHPGGGSRGFVGSSRSPRALAPAAGLGRSCRRHRLLLA